MRSLDRCVYLALLLWALTAFVALAQEATPVAEERIACQFPDIAGYQVLVADLHSHTTYSDGKLSPHDRVLEAYRDGYDVLAITDHGNMKAYPEAKEQADELGLVLLRGLESGMAAGEHIVIVGVSDEFVPRDSHRWASTEYESRRSGRAYYRDQLAEVERCGGVCIYPHPHYGLRGPYLWAIHKGYLVGVEVLNSCTTSGWGTVRSHGFACYPFALDWAVRRNLAVIANTDIHGTTKTCPPKARTLVLVSERSAKGVVDAIKARRTIAWFPEPNPMLWGHEELLKQYIGSVVSVRGTSQSSSGASRAVEITNRGAFPIKARIRTSEGPHTAVEVKQGETALVPLDGAPAAVRIEWTNLWTRSNRTLATVHRL